MSVQLEALADEVFDAAAAQSVISGQSSRRSYGLVVRNPDYPDLFFMNGIDQLVAPGWGVSELESALREALPGIQNLRVISRDPKTIAMLGPRLAAAGYNSEVRLAMVQVREPDSPPSKKISIATVETPGRWKDFETTIRADTAEHGWSDAMTSQMIRLHQWRAAHSPHHFFLAYDADRPVAHVGLYQHGANAYLHALYTLPAARNRGIGSALTIGMIGQAHAMGSERLGLQCVKESELPTFYDRLGFRPVGEQYIWTRPR